MYKKATFAGGCFWCIQPPFEKLDGVIKTAVGYTGGNTPNPTYEDVCAGKTGHAEALEITYDPEKVSYEKLLEVFWHNIDPTTLNQQFYDVGTQYRTAIFYHDEEQKQLAEASKQMLLKQSHLPQIATEITAVSTFYLAEDYHQKYYEKYPNRYQLYKQGSGREEKLKNLWNT